MDAELQQGLYGKNHNADIPLWNLQKHEVAFRGDVTSVFETAALLARTRAATEAKTEHKRCSELV